MGACASERSRSALTAEEIASENRAIGLMGQYDFERARELFAQLASAHPDRPELQVNLAIATLNRQRAGDDDAAKQTFEGVLRTRSDDLRAHFGLGLVLLHNGNARDALPHFSFVVEHDKADAYAMYFAAQCRAQLNDAGGALDGYRRAIETNPHLRSAAYGAFRSLQQAGRADEAQQMLDVFRNLEANPQAEVVEFKYTRMGRLAEARPADQAPRSRASKPAGPAFAPAAALPLVPTSRKISWRRFDALHPATITAADIDGDGRIDLFVAGAIDDGGRTKNAVLLNRGADGFQLDPDHTLAQITDVNAALWGDYDNDGLLDVYLCRRGANQLWRQTAKNIWSDVTQATGTGGGGGTTVDGAIFDADHDGDLDLFLVKSDAPAELLNNNSNGTFRTIGATIGLAGSSSSGVVVSDLDADRDADLVVIGANSPNQVLINERTWQYRREPAFDAFRSASVTSAVAGDVDADGRVELYTSGADGLSRWTRSASGSWQAQFIPESAPLANTRQLALVDVDGDGVPELVGSTTDGHWQVVPLRFGTEREASAERGNKDALAERGDKARGDEAPPIAGWALAILDARRGPSLVAMPADSGGPPVIWRPGAGRFDYATVALSGQDRNGARLRSNRSGLGAAIAARADSHWTAFTALRQQSGPGQSLQPIAIGTGGEPQIDFVAITWSDGVFQTELALAAGSLRQIEETERQLSSCPVLFAFDGSHFAFVTDLLGVGGMGTPTRPGVYDSPRPRESILLPEGLLQSVPDTPGRFALKITEPMEEAAYIDSARLIAYDLPPGWQMALDERKAISPPEATGAARFFRTEIQPVQAIDDGAGDVTNAIQAVDGVAAAPGALDRRFIGLTAAHSLTLRFEQPLDQNPGDPMLLADGWIEYPYAQTLFAAWQAGAAYEAPTIEARDSQGQWHIVRREFGYPAGMARRMSVPLGTLPRGTKDLRLRTNQEIYWDRLAIGFAQAAPTAMRHDLPLLSARVARTGYAVRELKSDRRPIYDYDARVPLWDARYQAGAYTSEGPMTELLTAEDGALAIIGPGEEIHLEFAAPRSPVKPGWTRRFVLDARGWCKDMDLYTRDGSTVEPLPGKRNAASARLQARYTIRYESGR
ncbi:MAG TPA: FG-GAP-like repeat-containing protein [Vicinamibacterales bacterium]